jgi:cell division protein FtsN
MSVAIHQAPTKAWAKRTADSQRGHDEQGRQDGHEQQDDQRREDGRQGLEGQQPKGKQQQASTSAIKPPRPILPRPSSHQLKARGLVVSTAADNSSLRLFTFPSGQKCLDLAVADLV